MSDLSLPSLSLQPTDAERRRAPTSGGAAGSTGAGDPTRFAWPTPPLAAYPLPVPSLEPEPCEVEGLGGKRVSGLLVGFDPDEGVVRVQVPPERMPVSLRFNQIRRITLKRSLAPLSAALVADAQGPAPERVLAHHPSQPYALTLAGGSRLVGRTVGHVDHPGGLFLFGPLDALGSLQRMFVPHVSIEQQQIGEPVGQLLLAQQAATPDQLEEALQQQQALRGRKLGEQLLEREVVSPEQLLSALDQQARMPSARLGDALIALGYLNEQQLQDALHQQRRDRELPLGEVLLDQGVVDDTQLRVALATKLGFPVVDVARFPIDRALLKVLPLTAARRLQVLPLMRRGGRLVVAMHDTSRQDVIDELQRLTQGPIAPTLSGDENLAEAIERAYGGGTGIAYPQPDDRQPGPRASARGVARRPEFAGRAAVPATLNPIDFDLPPLGPPGAAAPSGPVAPPPAAAYEPTPSDFIQISLDDLAASPVSPSPPTAAPALVRPFAPRPIASPPTEPTVPVAASATLTWAVSAPAKWVEPVDVGDAADATPPSDVVDLNDASDTAPAPMVGAPSDAGPTEAAALPVGEAAELRDTQVAALTGLGALVAARAEAAEPRPARPRRERLSTEATEAAASARAAADRHESPLLQTLSHLVLDALQRGATSIQIETQGAEDRLQVRLRRGGRLELHSELPASYRSPLFARIKALSDLDIAETRRPQEGRLAFARLVPQHKLDLRVLTLPTHAGLEDIVLGLPTRLKPMALDAIGLGATELERLQGLLNRPAGLILCVGPARSGRTTSLHAMLGQINQPERRIWTVEEPVALAQPGLRQMEIRPEEGQTFESGLRSVLATDADVLMVGQINDVGTARLAIDAALQGRLVLAGMTARNASDALMRLIDQGVTPWDLSDALLGVHSQRLLRRLCSTCRMSRSAKDTEVEEWIEGYFHGAVVSDPQAEREALLRGWIERHGRDGRLRRYQSPGCDRCQHTGQRGRVAVHELLLVTRELRRLVRAGAPAWNLQRQAQKDGMRTLRQEAVEKMVAGQVSLDEVRTVIDL